MAWPLFFLKRSKTIMEIRTIKIPEISKKPFTVTTSNRNVLRMHEYQLAVLKISDTIEDGDTQEQAQGSYSILKEMLGFIRAVLNLNDEDYDKLLDLENKRTQEIAEKLVGYMYGLTDEQLENASGEVDPKD
ncbi:tail chaperone protein [Streptococcus phage SWK1]|uniref:Tail chaperone protein n=19 Tax=Moineauvirus TaxID=1623304 RepID=A0A3S7W916_9CAUD|nr:tail protein [Streptococcus phage SW3]YP_010648108.1 tail protein [Streptococcus phage SW8]AYP30086.1 tail chaperone protein [Streptococcus phage SWK1]AYP30252.1 tail chaperone protein [Streptococcus phage SWK5]AYP29173.1 tail chaperone protein [Streptococcus phage SW3]AYP29303.1 tail chaperone protein [Streptococcus phage SW8]